MAHGGTDASGRDGNARQPKYDVAVYGGVPGGVAAAVAAARHGARVLLIEPTRHLGGLSTSGLNTAESEHMLTWTFGGIAQEFYQRLGKHYGMAEPAYYFESAVAELVFTDMLAESGVVTRFGRAVADVHKAGNRIQHIKLTDDTPVTANVFVDASYEGDLMARAGVDYTWGREGREEFGEDLAGLRREATVVRAATLDDDGRLLPGISGWASSLAEGAADGTVMCFNWRLTFSDDPDNRAPIPEPDHYDRARYRLLENWLRHEASRGAGVGLDDILDFYQHAPGRPDKKEVNNRQDALISLGHLGGQRHYPDAGYADRKRIVADHRDYTLGLFHFLAHDESVPGDLRTQMRRWGLAKDEFADNDHWPYQLYVREARRMRGAYVMTERDVRQDRRKTDAVAVGSHFVDSHHVQRLAATPTAFVNEGRIWRIGRAYQIPYRALTPRTAQCANLLVPGAASFSHVAFSTYRLECTWMTAGHAAGCAAATAAREETPVQEIDVPALQQELRAQGQVVDFAPGAPEHFTGGPGWPEF
ncbi:FAD-dependent oxidoreductase [Streptomyces sp. SBST2-5]|uniref:FAD-dependent oxidoreductase n=1 Tax=Streptomyces composti TaxID=2720025 RepID=A0ABX1A6S8_9ACTN|nr:FAD-dependent oxidoreductase [Streptomyces composti]NJP51985.1 FAD-dependent oxidoreductase [Streptomyces composti]